MARVSDFSGATGMLVLSVCLGSGRSVVAERSSPPPTTKCTAGEARTR